MECGRLATQTEMPVHHGPWCEQGPRSFPKPNRPAPRFGSMVSPLPPYYAKLSLTPTLP